MSKKAKVVVAYLRLSREDGNDESTSISNQRRIILEYAEKNNIKIEKFYIDDGESGFSFSKRPAFNELKDDLNADKVDINSMVHILSWDIQKENNIDLVLAVDFLNVSEFVFFMRFLHDCFTII